MFIFFRWGENTFVVKFNDNEKKIFHSINDYD